MTEFEQPRANRLRDPNHAGQILDVPCRQCGDTFDISPIRAARPEWDRLCHNCFHHNQRNRR